MARIALTTEELRGASTNFSTKAGELRELLRAVAHGLGEDALLAVEEGHLGGGGARVDCEDAHGYSPSFADAAASAAFAASAAAARMTSMATLPSISWTGAEREKSQTGAAKPCNTGP